MQWLDQILNSVINFLPSNDYNISVIRNRYDNEKNNLILSVRLNKALSIFWEIVWPTLIFLILLVSAFNLWVSYLTIDLSWGFIRIKSSDAGPVSTLISFILANFFTLMNPQYRYCYRERVYTLKNQALRDIINCFETPNYSNDPKGIQLYRNFRQVNEILENLDVRISGIKGNMQNILFR